MRPLSRYNIGRKLSSRKTKDEILANRFGKITTKNVERTAILKVKMHFTGAW